MAHTVLIAGCGDIGGRLGGLLVAAGWTVYGLRRNVAALPWAAAMRWQSASPSPLPP